MGTRAKGAVKKKSVETASSGVGKSVAPPARDTGTARTRASQCRLWHHGEIPQAKRYQSVAQCEGFGTIRSNHRCSCWGNVNTFYTPFMAIWMYLDTWGHVRSYFSAVPWITTLNLSISRYGTACILLFKFCYRLRLWQQIKGVMSGLDFGWWI